MRQFVILMQLEIQFAVFIDSKCLLNIE